MQYMDFSLLLYIGMLALGVLVGSRKSVRSRKLPWLGRLQSVALIALIAILGVEIGADDKVISSLGEIGLSALVITVFALAGSLLAVTLVRRLLGLDSQGELTLDGDILPLMTEVEVKLYDKEEEQEIWTRTYVAGAKKRYLVGIDRSCPLIGMRARMRG